MPAESLLFHASRNHVSNWLMARGEFPLAIEVRPKKVSDFADTEELRVYLVEVFADFLEQRQRGQVTDFRGRPDPLRRDFLRLGRGSMGGKARSIAFMAALKAKHKVAERWRETWPDVKVIVPRTAVICTDVFDRFCARGNLRERAMEAASDAEVAELFLAQPLDFELTADLASILHEVRYPLAVRSSSLLEDSEYQPLAGLYRTYLLPNCSPSDEVRLEQLSRAVRLVFASTFFRGPRTCMEATSLRIEEEKMAVIVQRLVGRRFGDRFYPHFAGVAQSHNYYPMGHMQPEDGIVTVALGLGHAVVSGGAGLRFSPLHPQVLPQMSSTGDALRNSQRELFALDLGDPDVEVGIDDLGDLLRLDLAAAEADGTLEPVGATYSKDNDRIYDSIHRSGVRLVNFAGVLKHDRFPLAPILGEVLEMGRQGMGTPCELEFAVALGVEEGQPSELALLQLRPLIAQGRDREVDLELAEGRPQLVAGPALGNGVIADLRDVVYVHPQRFSARDTPALAQAVARMNERLANRHRPYLLIGPGRWGTADRWLGVPVGWSQVSAARVIVELAMPGGGVDPSQGTHFFHNITSLRIGYFTLEERAALAAPPAATTPTRAPEPEASSSTSLSSRPCRRPTRTARCATSSCPPPPRRGSTAAAAAAWCCSGRRRADRLGRPRPRSRGRYPRDSSASNTRPVRPGGGSSAMKNERKRYVIAGAGGIGTAAGVLLAVVGREDCDLVLWDADPKALKRAHDRLPRDGHVRSVETLEVAPGETPEALVRTLEAADIVLDCLPGAAAPFVARLALDHRLHYVNLTEHVAETNEILAMARGADTGFALQTGLAPGFINVVALRLFHDFCRDFEVETVERIRMRVGALTVHAQAPHFYGFTWSPAGVATEYLEPAVVVRDFATTTRPSLSERETLIIDGVPYEEDLTSGGAADLPQALAGRVRDLDYKTLRYPGHYRWVEEQLAALDGEAGDGNGRIRALQATMERDVPRCDDDRVVVYASVQGHDEHGVPRLREEVHHVHPVELGGVRLRAIQTSTAAPLVEVAHMLLAGGYRGPVLQSEIDPYEFLGGRFVSQIYGT